YGGTAVGNCYGARCRTDNGYTGGGDCISGYGNVADGKPHDWLGNFNKWIMRIARVPIATLAVPMVKIGLKKILQLSGLNISSVRPPIPTAKTHQQIQFRLARPTSAASVSPCTGTRCAWTHDTYVCSTRRRMKKIFDATRFTNGTRSADRFNF